MDFVRPQSGAQATETTNTPTTSPEPAREPTRRDVPKPKRKYTVFKMAILVLLLFGALGGLGYLFLEERDRASTLEAEVSRLAQASGVESPVIVNKDTAAAAPASYTSKTSKFSITLPAKYTIVRVLDGPFEGGPATRLQIATAVNEGSNVVAAPSLDTVEVFAKPLTDSESFEEFVKNQLDASGTFEKQKDTTVAGVTAQSYTYDGLSVGKVYFFTKNGVAYKVSLDDTNSTDGQASFTEVTKNFKFN